MKLSPLPSIAAAAALAFALAGCGGVSATTTTSAPVGDNRPASTAGSTAAAAATSAAASSGVAKFGDTYSWKDGLAVTISAPEAYTPSQSAAGAQAGQQAVAFTITIVNKTSEPFDPVLFHVSAQSGNTEASAIYDSGNIGSTPTTKLLPGREVTFKVAFSVADPGDIVMEVRPDITHDEVLYQS